MLTPEDASYITRTTEGLSAPLYEALDHAYIAAHGHYDDSGLTGNGYTKGRTDLVRDHARGFIERRHTDGLDLGGWVPIETSSGRLHLRHDTMTIRVLHATPYEMVPAPGKNRARITYYENRTLDLLGVAGSNLIAVWLSPPDDGGEISVRIVRPIGEWKPGRTAKFDLYYELPRNTESFTDWEFIPDDEGFTLPFEFDEDVREEGEGSSA
ncbi:hypothetical protein AB0G95_34185 [Streptomyces virginiae]|uniref:hypothetical protein n=1 Tax=Streptomyces virginiae TaxID=1961 RepID=UPI00342A9483